MFFIKLHLPSDLFQYKIFLINADKRYSAIMIANFFEKTLNKKERGIKLYHFSKFTEIKLNFNNAGILSFRNCRRNKFS